jgi:hypothetical protein
MICPKETAAAPVRSDVRLRGAGKFLGAWLARKAGEYGKETGNEKTGKGGSESSSPDNPASES